MTSVLFARKRNAFVYIIFKKRGKHAFSVLMFVCIQCSSLNSNTWGSTKFILIMRYSNYEFALNVKRKYNGLSRNHNHLFELTGFLN